MKIRLFITSLFLFLVFNGISQSVEWKKPLVEKYVLENGLTVILNEDHTRPIVYGIVVTKAGSKNDPADATGMAHYQEHMLFKGTEQLGTTNWASEKPHIDKIFALYEELGKTTDIEKRKEIQQNINS
ncbi:MAG: peptidase M16, partial [Bacteroidetes bacterium CG_4_10_14_3_um_filter_31_20]